MGPRPPAEVVGHLIRTLHGLGADPRMLDAVARQLPAAFDDPDHWGELAYALRRARNYGAAEQVYVTALSVHPRAARLWNNYGVLLRDWGRLDVALDAFDHAIGIEPAYAKALAGKGSILEQLHRYPEARACYEAALATDPADVGSASNIGVCWLGEGDAAQADAWFERALGIDPDWTNALFNLAALRVDRGDRDGAAPLVERLAALLPDDDDVRRLRTRLAAGDQERLNLDVPLARTLESALSPRVQALCDQLAGNPRSIFISYAWTDPATKRLALRLSKDLQAHDWQAVLDQEQNLEVFEILVLLAHCQNVLVLNDRHYAESCLLGKVPVNSPSSVYPSFAFPTRERDSEAYMLEVFALSATAWGLARQLAARGIVDGNAFPFELAQPDEGRTPGLRLFVEGWRVDEVQMVFTNAPKYRSITIAYLGGDHCLTGYPLVDLSQPAYYDTSFAGLLRILDVGRELREGDAPIPFTRPDWTRYRWPDSPIVRSRLWRLADTQVTVWRPSLTPAGEAAAIINEFREWEPLPSAA